MTKSCCCASFRGERLPPEAWQCSHRWALLTLGLVGLWWPPLEAAPRHQRCGNGRQAEPSLGEACASASAPAKGRAAERSRPGAAPAYDGRPQRPRLEQGRRSRDRRTTARPSTVGTSYETVTRARPLGRSFAAEDPSALRTVRRLGTSEASATLGSALAEVPGVRIAQGGPGGESVTMRGAQGHQVAVFLDGIPLRSAGRGQVDLGLFDPLLLGEVEVRRSGGSTRFGDGALGGALLLRTPRLSSRLRAGISAALGSLGWMALRSHLAAGSGAWRWLSAASFRRDSGDFAFIDAAGRERIRANNDSERSEALLKLDRLWGNWRVSLLDTVALAERGAPGPAYDPSTSGRQHELREGLALAARGHGILSKGDRLGLRLAANYGYFRFRQADPERPPFDGRNHALGLTLRLDGAFPLLRIASIASAVELRQDFLSDTTSGDHSRSVAAVELVGRLTLFEKLIELAPAVRMVASGDFEAAVVPKFGVVVRPLSLLRRPHHSASPSARFRLQLEVLANIGRGYRLPTFEEQYVRLDGFGGNPELKPEDALSADFGARLRWAWLQLEGSYFWRALHNAILFAPVSSFLIRPDNYSDARAAGFEGALELGPVAGFALRASYTASRSVWGPNQLRFPGQPNHYIGLRASWSGTRQHGLALLLRRLSFWAQLRWQSGMPLDRFNNLLYADPRALVALGARYRFRQLSFGLEGQNLLDLRTAVDSLGFPLAPARFFASVDARFKGAQ